MLEMKGGTGKGMWVWAEEGWMAESKGMWRDGNIAG